MAEQEYQAADQQPHKPPLLFEIWLGLLETLINGFIDIDPDTRAQISAHAGLIMRVKTSDPFMLFYVVLTPEGVELYSHNPGPSKIRIGGSVLALSGALFGGDALRDADNVRIWGDNDNVFWFTELLRQYNLRTAAQLWLREHLNLKELLQKVNRHDPSWLSDLMPMPGMMREAMTELRKHRIQLQEQEVRLEQALGQLRAKRQRDVAAYSLALLVLLITLLPGASIEQRLHALMPDQVIGIAVVFILMAWRVLWPGGK